MKNNNFSIETFFFSFAFAFAFAYALILNTRFSMKINLIFSNVILIIIISNKDNVKAKFWKNENFFGNIYVYRLKNII